MNHRTHPLDDILFVWSVLQMNVVILQQSFYEGLGPIA